MYALARQINIVSTDQMAVCPIEFEFFLVCLRVPNGTFSRNVQKKWQKSASFFSGRS
jgi:hypothetical protein